MSFHAGAAAGAAPGVDAVEALGAGGAPAGGCDPPHETATTPTRPTNQLAVDLIFMLFLYTKMGHPWWPIEAGVVPRASRTIRISSAAASAMGVCWAMSSAHRLVSAASRCPG